MRLLPPQLVTELKSNVVHAAYFADLTFRTKVEHVWTGVGPITLNGIVYSGLGTLAGVGVISETSELEAKGTTISLSGIDPELYAESMDDIQVGAPATVWFGALIGGVLPVVYKAFSGQMDTPTVDFGADTITISIALETKLIRLQHGSQRRYTSADQQRLYPDDCGFSWVPLMNDIAVKVRG